MIFMVFCGPGGSLGRPKSEKKPLKGEMEKKTTTNIVFFFFVSPLWSSKSVFRAAPGRQGAPKTGVGGMVA